MREVNNTVGKANEYMAELNRFMEEISRASEQTSKIVKNRDEIASQTNLLKLNAAVKTGAGFTVVADQVRKLAHFS